MKTPTRIRIHSVLRSMMLRETTAIRLACGAGILAPPKPAFGLQQLVLQLGREGADLGEGVGALLRAPALSPSYCDARDPAPLELAELRRHRALDVAEVQDREHEEHRRATPR